MNFFSSAAAAGVIFSPASSHSNPFAAGMIEGHVAGFGETVVPGARDDAGAAGLRHFGRAIARAVVDHQDLVSQQPGGGQRVGKQGLRIARDNGHGQSAGGHCTHCITRDRFFEGHAGDAVPPRRRLRRERLRRPGLADKGEGRGSVARSRRLPKGRFPPAQRAQPPRTTGFDQRRPAAFFAASRSRSVFVDRRAREYHGRASGSPSLPALERGGALRSSTARVLPVAMTKSVSSANECRPGGSRLSRSNTIRWATCASRPRPITAPRRSGPSKTFPISGWPPRPRTDSRAGPGEVGRRRGQSRPGQADRHRARTGSTTKQVDSPAGRLPRSGRGQVRRRVPDRRLSDRLGHLEQHERQRGDQQSGDRALGRRPLRQAEKPIHPNDHVNMGQSTNDMFPTAIHVAVGARHPQTS